MPKLARLILPTLLAIASVGPMATITAAAPLPVPAATAAAPSALIEQVQFRRGRGIGLGIGAGIIGGAIIGSALARPYYYERPYYAYPRASYYYAPPPRYYADPDGDADAYCFSRFRSYDPRTRTYLGYDGYRHPCP